MPNHYQTLKVAEDAPPEVIKAAYRALSQHHHPDSNPPEQEAQAVNAMQAINAAYEVLIEPGSRAVYDQGLQAERTATAATTALAVEPGTGASGSESTATGSSLVPDPRGGPATSRSLDLRDSDSGEGRRRRRRSSSEPSTSRSNRLSRSSGGALVPRSADALYGSSAAHQLARPMFSSSAASVIHGRGVPRPGEEGDTETSTRGGKSRSGGSKTFRLVIYILFILGLGMMALLGLVAWRTGLLGRFQVWYERGQRAAEGLPVSSGNDVLPMASMMTEKPYNRPTQTPQGHPWPTSTGYLPGTPVLWNDGRCEITVDNTLHDSDVHVKLVAMAIPEGGGGGTTVREAYLQRGARMRFETLRPGTYELRYQAHLTGTIVRAATVELTQPSDVGASAFGPAVTLGSAAGSSVMVSLYKVAPGNSQRPILDEGEF